jgi:hypothetical protein
MCHCGRDNMEKNHLTGEIINEYYMAFCAISIVNTLDT